MTKILTIALQSLRILLKDKYAFIWMLLMPTVYIFFFGNVFNSQNDHSKLTASLDVYNQDKGALSRVLIDGLKSENVNAVLLDSMPDEVNVRLLIIPPDFTSKVLALEKTELEFVAKQGTNIEAEMTVSLAIKKSYFRLLADLVEITSRGDSVTIDNVKELEARKPLIAVKSSYAGKHKIIPSGFNQYVPANIVMFAMLIIFVYSGNMIMDEKKSGLFRRIYIAPVNFLELFLGKLSGSVLVGLVQITILVLVGRFLFGVYYGPSFPALFLLALFFAASIASIGLTLGMFIKSEEKMNGIAVILALAMSAISGCWWPAEVSPQWMNSLSNFLPSGIALSGFHQLISYGRGMEAIYMTLIKLGSIAVLFALIFAGMLSRFDKTQV